MQDIKKVSILDWSGL